MRVSAPHLASTIGDIAEIAGALVCQSHMSQVRIRRSQTTGSGNL
jgi:hypothetical protein